MLFQQDRQQLRSMYAEAWRKFRDSAPMEPLERLIAEVLQQHPEYHALIEDPTAALDQDFPNDIVGNPFLHMGLHIALREQLSTDRPRGIVDVFSNIVCSSRSAHAAEHTAMECLASALWAAQERKEIPNERAYLSALRKIAGNS